MTLEELLLSEGLCLNCCGAGVFGLDSECRECGGSGKLSGKQAKRLREAIDKLLKVK